MRGEMKSNLGRNRYVASDSIRRQIKYFSTSQLKTWRNASPWRRRQMFSEDGIFLPPLTSIRFASRLINVSNDWRWRWRGWYLHENPSKLSHSLCIRNEWIWPQTRRSFDMWRRKTRVFIFFIVYVARRRLHFIHQSLFDHPAELLSLLPRSTRQKKR